MIAVDTSALVAIAFGEDDAKGFLTALSSNECVVGAPTVFETRLVVDSERSATAAGIIEDLLALPNLVVIAFERSHVAIAREAFKRYGRGRGHPAKLNMGDCLTYAVAKVHDVPLLYKGDDFRHTDVSPALS